MVNIATAAVNEHRTDKANELLCSRWLMLMMKIQFSNSHFLSIIIIIIFNSQSSLNRIFSSFVCFWLYTYMILVWKKVNPLSFISFQVKVEIFFLKNIFVSLTLRCCLNEWMNKLLILIWIRILGVITSFYYFFVDDMFVAMFSEFFLWKTKFFFSEKISMILTRKK